jgi:hypothetical protein
VIDAAVSRLREGGTSTSPRSVAATGMARSTPGCSQTRQTRPSDPGMIVILSRGSFSP